MKKSFPTPNALKPLQRGIAIVIAVVLVCTIVARKYLQYVTPLYESTAKIRLADTKEGFMNNNLYKNVDVFTNSSKIGTEVEMLRSPVLIEKVVQRLNIGAAIYRVGDLHKKELYDQSPLKIDASGLDPSLYDKTFGLTISHGQGMKLTLPTGQMVEGTLGSAITFGKSTLLITFNDTLLSAKPGMQINDDYEFVVNSSAKLVENIIGGLDITAVDKDIPVLRISYKSPVAKKSADIVNAVAATYIADYIEEKYRSADTTECFLENQLKAYSGKLSASEAQIQGYRDRNNIVNIHQETETDLRKIADLKKQLASVRMNLEAVDSLNQYVKAGKTNFTELAPNFQAFNDLLSTEIVKDMKHLQADKKDLLTRYTPENEKVKVIDDKLEDLSQYLEEGIKNTESDLRIKYNDLQQTIRAAEAGFTGLPEKERNMTILERNFSLNEQVYRFLQEKKTDAEIAKAATMSFHRIIARGEVPDKPVSPNAKLITVFAAFLGLIFSVIGIYGVHHLKARVDNENIIYRHTDIPLAGIIPYTANAAAKQNAFNHWALELQLQNQLNEGSILTVSALKHKEGKHYVASGLAAAIAGLGKKTLFVSLTGRNAEHAGFDQVYPQQPAWQLPAKWYALTEQWKQDYEVIVIENLSLQEAKAMLPLSGTDVKLFVLDSRISKIKDIAAIEDLTTKINLRHASFVLNRAGYIPSLIPSFLQFAKNLGK